MAPSTRSLKPGIFKRWTIVSWAVMMLGVVVACTDLFLWSRIEGYKTAETEVEDLWTRHLGGSLEDVAKPVLDKCKAQFSDDRESCLEFQELKSRILQVKSLPDVAAAIDRKKRLTPYAQLPERFIEDTGQFAVVAVFVLFFTWLFSAAAHFVLFGRK